MRRNPRKLSGEEMLAIDGRLRDAFGVMQHESLHEAAERIVRERPTQVTRARFVSLENARVRNAAHTLLRLHYVERWEAMRRAARKLDA